MFWLAIALTTLSCLLAEDVATLEISPNNCLFGCFDALALAPYADIPATAGYYDGYCNSTIFTTSILSCSETYCTSTQQDAGWTLMTEYCLEYGLVALPTQAEVKALITETDIPRIAFTTDPPTMINDTVIPDEASFQLGFRTEVSHSTDRS